MIQNLVVDLVAEAAVNLRILKGDVSLEASPFFRFCI